MPECPSRDENRFPRGTVVILAGETVDFVAVTTGLRGWDRDGCPWHEIRIAGNSPHNGIIETVLDSYLRPTSITTAQFQGKHGIA